MHKTMRRMLRLVQGKVQMQNMTLYILMAETIYSISTLQHLHELIKKCITRPHGVVYLAAKKHYFGVGGGTQKFLSVVKKDAKTTTMEKLEVNMKAAATPILIQVRNDVTRYRYGG